MTTRDPEQNAGDRGSAVDETAAPDKKPYRRPRLTIYGNLRQLALQKGGTKPDGKNVPSSRT
jgi:hypothetical protein